jgi:phosphate:Na+ symporter
MMAFWQALAGLGLFLFGMRQLELALELMAGHKFNQFIVNSTNQPVRSVSTGIFATAMVQSSSLVGLITLAFVGTGIMPLVNGVGVVLGSNLGTTVTGWMVATLGFKLDMSVLVYPLLGIGGLGYGLLKGRIKAISLAVLALALLLFGLNLMKGSFSAFSQDLQLGVLQGYPLIVYLLFGVVITAIIQSSSVMMALALAAIHVDLLTLPAAAALVIGADLGTTSTVLLGSLQGTAPKRRLALAHVIFNLVVDVLAFLSIGAILYLIQLMSISDPLFGLVAFHSIFNLVGLLLFLPFIQPYSHWLERVIKTRKQNYGVGYINVVPPAITEAGLQALTLETQRLISLVLAFNMRLLKIKNESINSNDLPEAFRHQNNTEFYAKLKGLEGEIINYAFSVQKFSQASNQKKPQNDAMSHQIDCFMQSIRAAIYAAKSTKDISQNIQQFEVDSKPEIQQKFSQIIQSADKHYQKLVSLMSMDDAILAEELLSLKESANKSRRQFRHQIHQHMSGHQLESTELSTLLNVNMEVYNSISALIKALLKISSN